MLKKFKVRGFRNFKDWFTFDLSNAGGYQFNPECVIGDIVKTGVIYGPNGCGKSNLGRAIFDIKNHLTDEKLDEFYHSNYLNAESKIAEFKFIFDFDGTETIYSYSKESAKKLLSETLEINGEIVISFDREKTKTGRSSLKGTETLNLTVEDDEISILKYVRNNSQLEENKANKAFYSTFLFIETMELINSVNAHDRLKFQFTEFSNIIFEADNLKNLETFISDCGIECTLGKIDDDLERRIALCIGNKKIDFSKIASTGTLSVAEFFLWISILDFQISGLKGLVTPFRFFDEFDAFYHHDLSRKIVSLLKEKKAQAIFSTHNTSIMNTDLLRPDCYFIMSDKEIKSMHDSTRKELREAHNIEKMYRSGSFSA